VYWLIPETVSANILPAVVQAPAAGPYELLLFEYQISADARRPESCDFVLASLPLPRAEFKEASTTDERIPMMAITTRSSMRVKPRDFLLLVISIFKSFIILIMVCRYYTPPAGLYLAICG